MKKLTLHIPYQFLGNKHFVNISAVKKYCKTLAWRLYDQTFKFVFFAMRFLVYGFDLHAFVLIFCMTKAILLLYYLS